MDRRIHILILEDNVSDAELMQRELRRAGFDLTVRFAQDRETFTQALNEPAPDLILADYSLPGFDGLTAMYMARRKFAEIPVIIVSGAIGEETAIETLKAGATDYVLKQKLSRLGPVVHRALREAEELIERKQAEQALRQQVYLLQRALLPSAPITIEGYSVASTYIPGYAGLEIGGDFYDIFRTESGKVGILIGDVAGKGIEAASLAAATRSTVRAFAYETSSAAEALEHANSVLTRNQTTEGQFVTVFLAILDTASGEICYASAGHPPLALYHASGDVEFLSLGNLPIGVLEPVSYLEGRTHLEPGGKIVLYTDGITEARRGLELFGEEGIEGVLELHGHLPPDDVVGQILTASSEWADGRITDDVAILVIGREVVPNME